MSIVQVDAWRMAEFVGPDSLPLFHRECCQADVIGDRVSVAMRARSLKILLKPAETDPQTHGGVELARELRLDGRTAPAGAPVHAEKVITLGAFGQTSLVTLTIDGLPPLAISSAPLEPGQSLEIEHVRDAGAHLGAPGLVRGTKVTTPHGILPVERLGPGDEVMDDLGRITLLESVCHHRIPAAELLLCPGLLPIRITAGSLGYIRPETDILLAPAQPVHPLARAGRASADSLIPVGAQQLGLRDEPSRHMLGVDYVVPLAAAGTCLQVAGLAVSAAPATADQQVTAPRGHGFLAERSRPLAAEHGGA